VLSIFQTIEIKFQLFGITERNQKMVIKGINTAPIIQNERLFLMSFKFRDSSDNERMFFMQIPTLVDFLIILRGCALRVGQRLTTRGDDYKTKCIAENEVLAKNIPEITQVEVMQPDPGNLVMSIAPKISEENFSLVAVLHNEHVITLDIDDTQAEFIIMAVKKAIDHIKDDETLRMISIFMDFMVLFDINLSDINNLKYNQLNHEPWKQYFYARYVAVLYCFDTDDGKQLLAGNIIKMNVDPVSQEGENILQQIAMLTPTCKAMREKHTLCQTFSQVIPSKHAQVLSRDECLRALHNFCLETKTTLNQ